MFVSSCVNIKTVRVFGRFQVEVKRVRFRYREIERRELDRHSYEIQIKELNHRLAEESGFRE